MRAVIVAAGRSSRLYPLTENTPKCLLEINGETLIARSLRLLNAIGITDTVIVVGFFREKVEQALDSNTRTVFNPYFAETNNMASLWLALPYLQGQDFIYSHADVIYDPAMLAELGAGSTNDMDLLVDPNSKDEEAMKVRTREGRFVESSKAIRPAEAAGEWTGLARISGSLIEPLGQAIMGLMSAGRLQDYDTSAFNELAKQGTNIGLVSTQGRAWCELDTFDDLERARAMFES